MLNKEFKDVFLLLREDVNFPVYRFSGDVDRGIGYEECIYSVFEAKLLNLLLSRGVFKDLNLECYGWGRFPFSFGVNDKNKYDFIMKGSYKGEEFLNVVEFKGLSKYMYLFGGSNGDVGVSGLEVVYSDCIFNLYQKRYKKYKIGGDSIFGDISKILFLFKNIDDKGLVLSKTGYVVGFLVVDKEDFNKDWEGFFNKMLGFYLSNCSLAFNYSVNVVLFDRDFIVRGYGYYLIMVVIEIKNV